MEALSPWATPDGKENPGLQPAHPLRPQGDLVVKLTVDGHGAEAGIHGQGVTKEAVAFFITLSVRFRFFNAWKKYHDEQGHGLFEGNNEFLLASARCIVLTGHAARDGYADQLADPSDAALAGLQQSMDLVWRALGVWLTVLALLLLINVIS